MKESLTIKRTAGNDKDFNILIQQLDHELWKIMNEVQAVYDQFNKVPDINTVVIAYIDSRPVGCGCFKRYSDDTVEIKRMFVVPEARRRSVAQKILFELELWAKELNFANAVLETGKRMTHATSFYFKNGYAVTDNYGQYIGLEESVCMKKELFKISSSK